MTNRSQPVDSTPDDHDYMSEAENNGIFRSILRAMREGIICTDPDGAIIEVNRSAEKLLNIRRDEVLGKSLFDLHPDNLAEQIRSAWPKFKHNVDYNVEIVDCWDADRWVALRLSSFTDHQGQLQGVITCYKDHTEQKNLEDKQRSLELKLIQEHKLSAIGILASGIAHNLNGPLSIIIGYLDLLYSRNPSIEELPIILTQGERMKDIISNMMIKSRHEQDTRKKSINLNTLLQNELKFLEANLEFKHHIDKHYEFTPNLPSIYGIYSDFSQCFLNIINNAIDAMVDAKVKSLEVKTECDQDNIIVTFRDTGCGIDPAHADKLFSPFFSTKPPVGEAAEGRPTGTGLGLSSAYQLVKSYGGTISVNGWPGQGAEFKVTLPIAKNAPPSLEPPGETEQREESSQKAASELSH